MSFTAAAPARALLLSGVPIRERVGQYGPFVMNTAQEIEQAILDYRRGRLGGIDHGTNETNEQRGQQR